MSLEFGNQSKSYLSKLVRQGANSFVSMGFEQITVDATIQRLTVPAGAKYALCVIESDNTTAIVARCLQHYSSSLASGVGVPLKDGSTFDITMTENLSGFCITEEAAHTTILNVEYFK